MEESLENRLSTLRKEVAETRAFLQTYLVSPDGENRPAETERIKQLLTLAGELTDILKTLADQPQEEVAAATTAAESLPGEEDINLEFNTHTLGTPDGSDNIEGDWAVDGDSTTLESAAEEETLAEEPEAAPEAVAAQTAVLPVEEGKKKKGKKHKKGKKGKKGKKH